MADPVDSAERLAAFGRWLARERELRGLGREEVTRAMKLAPGVLEALESGQGGAMPPRAYAVGYLRAYAAAVGLDADQVLLRFEEATAPAAAEPGKRRESSASIRVVLALVLAAAVAGAGVWALLRS